MPRTLVLLVSAVAVLALSGARVSAAPCGPTTCAPLSSAVAGSKVLFVRPHGQFGPLVAYDLASGRVVSRLPDGVLSADGRRFVSTTNEIQRTRIVSRDPSTGARVGVMRIPAWSAKVDAVSADGRYAALTWARMNPDVYVVDLVGHRVVRKVHFDGSWTVDGLSRDAQRLYLIEYQGNGSGSGYRVRVHDAVQGLLPDPITDPRDPEPMIGTPWSSIGSPDGRWQLTLYLKPSNTSTEPFVHALSLGDARASCLDLPGGDFVRSGRYALILAPNGRMLYAANPSLGVVATVDLQRKAVVARVRFRPVAASQNTSAAFGAVSRDGRSVFFTSGRDVLAYDAASRTVRGPYRIGEVSGLGFDPSGKTVLVVKGSGTTARLDVKSGALVPPTA